MVALSIRLLLPVDFGFSASLLNAEMIAGVIIYLAS